jgi:hypothetical protein
VENQGKLMPKPVFGWSDGEQGTSPDLLAIRSLLRSLPTLECAPGFEYRLQRKLEAGVAGVRSEGTARNWALGWGGVGLGFATALAIAFFAFDLNVKEPNQPGGIAGGVTSGGPAIPVPTQTVSEPSHELQASAPANLQDDKKLASVKKDSTVKPPVSKVDVDQGLIHVTGGGAPK